MLQKILKNAGRFVLLLAFVKVSSAEIIYQDYFGDNGLADNAGIGGGALSQMIQDNFWIDDGSATFATTATGVAGRAILYSENDFQSDGGFRFTVDYFSSGHGTAGDTGLSFGLVSTETNLNTFDGVDPFGSEAGLNSVGVSLTSSGHKGLNLTAGSAITNLEDGSFIANADTPVTVHFENDGSGEANWSWSIDGFPQGSGSVPVFDFSKSYHFVVYGEDSRHQRRVNSVTLEAISPSSGRYVATTGSDANAGTINSPFLTIQHAVNQLQPGETLNIRGGSYHEEVSLSGVAGTSSNPIKIQNYKGEKVVLDGTIPITSDWSLDSGNVYKTTLAGDITQLFVDEKPMTLARFPNALAFSDEAFTGNVLRLKNFDTEGGGQNGR
ncbi:hypothetical protein OAF27_03050, partial [Verrucomicrobiales bacterium]|nr:hypothetical protein [Verrucomicrobiales bacterium]